MLDAAGARIWRVGFNKGDAVFWPDAPARWGEMRRHLFYGALYHFFVLTANRSYSHFRPIAAWVWRRSSGFTCAGWP